MLLLPPPLGDVLDVDEGSLLSPRAFPLNIDLSLLVVLLP